MGRCWGFFTTECTEDTEEVRNPSGDHECSGRVIDAALAVHRALGPGLLESAYEACLAHELTLRSIDVRRQLELPVLYRGLRLDIGYRIDLLVDGSLIVEVKAVSKVLPIHQAQLLSYLRLSRLRVGLLLNFNVDLMRNGIQRVLNG